jgi:2-polyprenyl-6-methoxyphenol hydroxylase-like FAD-dependent oxidoreductase
MMVSPSLRFDVLVLGGGPAGCAAVIELAGQDRIVALVERSEYDADRVGDTPAPEAVPWLDRLGHRHTTSPWDCYRDDVRVERSGTRAHAKALALRFRNVWPPFQTGHVKP